uniref:Uncharacterized protein n=1 Tax=Arundo donax TaxID=35708 RepID=A0A0A8YGD6_ARUDO
MCTAAMFISDLNCAYNLTLYYNRDLTCTRIATCFNHIHVLS